MDQRYSLRFEAGERRGETIPVSAPSFTVGRRPGQTLQILDNSVSGKHAEIVVDAEGALLRDLGSTNGTRVGAQRVIETRLAHGDRVTFGNVQLVFLDASMGASPAPEAEAPTGSVPAPTSSAAAVPGPADALVRVSPEILARAKKKSRLGLVVVAVLLVAGGAAWWMLNRGGSEGGERFRTVQPVPDNLLAEDFSFETGEDAWSPADGAPAAFLKGAQGRYSGALGLACDLGAADYALQRSKDLHVEPEREIVARAMVRASGDTAVRLGVEFFPEPAADAPAPGPIVAWSKSARGEQGSREFEPLEISAPVPPGYTGARIVVEARGAGSAAFDDASAVARAGAAKPAAALGEWQLHLLGAPASVGMLFRVGRVMLSDLELGDGLELHASAEGVRMRVSSTTPPGSTLGRLVLRAEAPLCKGGIATIAAGTYKTQGLDFEAADAQSLLLGSGPDLVCFRFATPVAIRAVSDGPATRIEVTSPGLEGAEFQLDFRDERKKAGDLAFAARNAEKKGDLGECLARWSELLNNYPYEEAVVVEAESVRAKLSQQGFEELRVVRMEVDRARFFRLVDLYRQCRQKAVKVGERYRASDVETEAQALAAEVDKDLVGLEADLTRAERDRLAAILKALEAQKADALAAEVRDYIATRFGGTH